MRKISPKASDLVRAEIDHAVRDHHIRPLVLDRHRLDQPVVELDVGEATLSLAAPAALERISSVMSMPMTRPAGPTWRAAMRLSMPAPEPMSTTCSPAARSPMENGLPVPANDSMALSGMPSSSCVVVADDRRQRSAGVEMETLVRVTSDFRVLVADFAAQGVDVDVGNSSGNLSAIAAHCSAGSVAPLVPVSGPRTSASPSSIRSRRLPRRRAPCGSVEGTSGQHE